MTTNKVQRDWDSTVQGLFLNTALSGKQTWKFYYRTKCKRQHMIKIGDYPQMAVAEARRIAKSHREKIAMGEDPKRDWDQARDTLTVQELFDLVWKEYWNQKRFLESGWAKMVKLSFEKHIQKTFGSLRISEVKTFRVKSWHSALRETPVAANRALEVFSKMYSFAIENELFEKGSNPCLIKAHTERRRKRYASEEEIEKLGRILHRELQFHRREATFLLLLMYTGSRPRAIERALKSQIRIQISLDGKRHGILQANGKSSAESGEEEEIVFPSQALDLIDQLHSSTDCPKDGSLAGSKLPRTLWQRVRKEAGCSDLWARDWRRTFATLGLSQGVDSNVIGEVQNHRTAQTRLIYQKLLPVTRVNAVEKIADTLEGIASGTRGFEAQSKMP